MSPFCVAVDWGTSNFRLWVLDRAGGVLAFRNSDEGLQHSIANGFQAILENHLFALEVDDSVPVILCGMAGSRQGWCEAPYVDTPANFVTLVSKVVRVPHPNRQIFILPGIAQRDETHPDVMRGEETLLMGAADNFEADSLICMPGTHSKWVELKSGVVQRFSTYLTGELFGLLTKYSILKLGFDQAAEFRPDDDAFLNAVKAAMSAPQQVTNRLFEIRASGLLGFAASGKGAAQLSGNVIGLELAGVKATFGNALEVNLIASGHIGSVYQSALNSIGIATRKIDSQDAVRHGLFCAAVNLWGVTEQGKRREA